MLELAKFEVLRKKNIFSTSVRSPGDVTGSGAARPLMAAPLLGLIGGTAQWLFARDDVASVTVSAARALAERPAADIAAEIWPEVARALDIDAAEMPPVRVVKERRATFLASPAQIARRPAPQTSLINLVLAGDYTDTGLPATIEGAIRSGRTAAMLALR